MRLLTCFPGILIMLAMVSPGLDAQVLKGTILDSESGDPVGAVTVFFNNHQQGTFSDKDGRFELIIPEGEYLELVVSHIAFNNRSLVFNQPVSADTTLRILLSPSQNQLEEVNIAAEPDREWKKSFKKFESSFMGRTENASRCEIINPFVVNFTVKNGILTASSDHLLEIENRSTGYTVYFLLEHFKMEGNRVSYSGKPFFEMIPPENNKKLRNWEKNREKTYLGSRRHFLNSLINGRLVEEGYEMFRAELNSNGEFITKEHLEPRQVIYADGPERYLMLENFLMVVYKKEKSTGMAGGIGPLGKATGGRGNQELSMRARDQFRELDKFQTSYLFGRKQKLRIFDDGTLRRPELLQEYGYWASEGVADLLPFDYEPGS